MRPSPDLRLYDERGKNSPAIHTLWLLAAALEVRPAEVVRLVEQKTEDGPKESSQTPSPAGAGDGRYRHRVADRPPPKSAVVSAQMSRMPRSSTGPEVRLRRELHARGLRFRAQGRGLPGTPDVVFSKARVAVFIDGCFWHGCPEHCVLPKNNGDWWAAKLAGNTERDRRKDRELVELGWLPLHFWEHAPVSEIAHQIVAVWRQRTGRS